MDFATRFPCEIVSCDSQQVYQGLDIGTGKPTSADRERVPHHLIDLVPPTENFHAARWATLARSTIKEIAARGTLPLVVGGTGLYLRALLSGLFDAPPASAEIRARHQREADESGVESLHARLALVDPDVAARVMPRDLVRISRALEVFEQTGEKISVLQKRAAAQVDLEPRILILDPPLAELRARIERRFDAMMAEGLLDETQRLRLQFGRDARGLTAIGYKEMGAHLDGVTSLDEAVTLAKNATVAYARRQRTWFRKREHDEWRLATAPSVDALWDWWRRPTVADAGD